jgi:hypothetical protein
MLGAEVVGVFHGERRSLLPGLQAEFFPAPLQDVQHRQPALQGERVEVVVPGRRLVGVDGRGRNLGTGGGQFPA